MRQSPFLSRRPDGMRRGEWVRTRLLPRERDELTAALTSAQSAQLLEHDYVWIPGKGVLWKAPEGDLRRARFTHGIHFRTQRGEFYIDSEGNARARSGSSPAAATALSSKIEP
jgi:hypothetical protein